MNLATVLIFFLEFSFSQCKSITFGEDNDGVLFGQKLIEDAYIFDHLEETRASKSFDTDFDMKVNTNMIESDEEPPFLPKRQNDIDVEIEKRAVHTAGSEDINDKDTELNSENTSHSQKKNNKVEHSIERYMASFYMNMINLLQYEIKEIADRESSTRQHLRKQRKPPGLRPKRSLRSLLKDVNIKKILIKYFQHKQSQDHGNPLLRYG